MKASNTILRERLLAFIEYHFKAELRGIHNSFPDASHAEILAELEELQTQGWVKINQSFVVDGFVQKRPCVYRTKKTMYSQPLLFDII